MSQKIRKHFKKIYPIKSPALKETLRTHSGNVPLNISQEDRISFSVLRNENNKIRKIENVSYEMSIHNKWEWIVRYDDHGGSGYIHRHYRLSLKDNSDIVSVAGIKRYSNKNYGLTWIFKDIKRNYIIFRSKFLKKMGLDLY